MRLGLYYDLRNPGAARPWARVYASALERIAWADAEGIGAVWVTEHHGFADGYLPAPLTFCAAIAARTSRARIGTAVVVSPLMRPVALAEQAAVVDILSTGRLELGLGAGWREAEFAAFGADYAGRYRDLEETIRALPQLWESGQATPAPLQRPLPVWVGARGPRGARLAGRTGSGLLWIDRDLLEPYLAGLAQLPGAARPPGPPRPRIGGLVNIFLADDPERAWAAIRRSARRNAGSYSGADVSGKQAAFPRLQVLTPADAATHIAQLCAGLPVTDVFCFGDIGGLEDHFVERHTELAVQELRKLLPEGGPR
jgi:alkanesulfonate monooxygenase SsuD/methylene tetrahydromethanopterin reductase-like flavin-dependent oxidoreductase (luciferase family)